jgi:hypothetical protein
LSSWQDRAVATVPFQGLSPAESAEHARWFVDAMANREGVALVVPAGFEAYARLLHPLASGQRWSTVAADYLRRSADRYPYPFPDLVVLVEGNMGTELVDALTPLLAVATTTSQHCHFGLWGGWGELHPQSHSPLHAVTSRQSPVAAMRSRREFRQLERSRRRAEAPLYAFVESCAVTCGCAVASVF